MLCILGFMGFKLNWKQTIMTLSHSDVIRLCGSTAEVIGENVCQPPIITVASECNNFKLPNTLINGLYQVMKKFDLNNKQDILTFKQIVYDRQTKHIFCRFQRNFDIITCKEINKYPKLSNDKAFILDAKKIIVAYFANFTNMMQIMTLDIKELIKVVSKQNLLQNLAKDFIKYEKEQKFICLKLLSNSKYKWKCFNCNNIINENSIKCNICKKGINFGLLIKLNRSKIFSTKKSFGLNEIDRQA